LERVAAMANALHTAKVGG